MGLSLLRVFDLAFKEWASQETLTKPLPTTRCKQGCCKVLSHTGLACPRVEQPWVCLRMLQPCWSVLVLEQCEDSLAIVPAPS